ncbi:methyltransferase domain-containing protein [Candidatus Bipolaricaulota bacterium]|nr:methyltransferase domain-containing protein [Candidatus Bipolaricaulota bacterium]
MDRTPYSKLAEVYDVGWGDFAESTRTFVERTLSTYGIESGRILELACGTGILAIHLAQSGHIVLGIDRSPEMVSIASMKGRYVKGVEFSVADMRNLDLEPEFDAALCMFDSLNYLTTLEEVSDALKSVSSNLRSNGVFIFDFNRPLIYSAHNGETLKRHVEDGILFQELHYEVAQRTARTVFRFPNGDVETHLQRAYELDEIVPLLKAADLSLENCYSDFSRRPVSSLSERLICVCVKR